MYTLTVKEGSQTFRFRGSLDNLTSQAQEFESACITDIDGNRVLSLGLPALLSNQSM